jgi:hypothetical protein
VKGEVRHDAGWIGGSPDDLFIDSDDLLPGIYSNQNQTLFGAEVIYSF